MKDDFNKDDITIPVTPPKEISEKDLLNSIENLSSVAPTNEMRFDTLKYRNVYFERKDLFEKNLPERDANFILGQRTGLHREQNLQNLYAKDNEQRSQIRSEVHYEAKIHYHQNYSLSKSFGEVNKDKPKEKDMNLEKG